MNDNHQMPEEDEPVNLGHLVLWLGVGALAIVMALALLRSLS